nr:sugar nucleotide-binding protein [Salinispora cortesiana]
MRAGQSLAHTCVPPATSPKGSWTFETPPRVRDLVQQVRPDAVIHTAAGRDDWRAMADEAAPPDPVYRYGATKAAAETAVAAVDPAAAVVRTSLILGYGRGTTRDPHS